MFKICPDCGQKSIYHFKNWVEVILDHLISPRLFSFLPRNFKDCLEKLVEKFFIWFRLISVRRDFSQSDIRLRTTVFIDEAKKRGINFQALWGPFGETNRFRLQIKGKSFSFEGLPRAEFLSKRNHSEIIDDKYLVKKYLKKANLPVLSGRAFWWFQKKAALKFAKKLDFPLVVKPRSGSISSHLTTDIRDIESLRIAISKAISYSPTFIIEKFLPGTHSYRATVIDFDNVFCVQQIPANVVGNGTHTIRELIKIKNSDQKRGNPQQKNTTLSKLVINEMTENLLETKGYNFSTIPTKGEIIYLQKDPFLKLGGDLVEVTSRVHPDNFQLFRNIAKFFDVRLVGIDFLTKDISQSWKTQPSAILELNSLPCIEMHHFPSLGQSQNVAKALVNMVLKYYL